VKNSLAGRKTVNNQPFNQFKTHDIPLHSREKFCLDVSVDVSGRVLLFFPHIILMVMVKSGGK
jgi:hypothetical protein